MTPLCRAMAVMVIFCCISASPAHAFEGGRYGPVKLVEPTSQARGFVIFFSGRHGLTSADDAAAHEIATAGAMVVEVDTSAYLRRLDKLDEDCHEPEVDAEWLSRQIQRERSFPNYLTPILAGVGEGATLAVMTLAYAPVATIAGVVALDPTSTIRSKRPLCVSEHLRHRAHAFRYEVPKSLPGFCVIEFTPNASKRDRHYMMESKRKGAPFQIEEVALHQSIGDTLRALIEPHLAKPPLAKPPLANRKVHLTDISSLPLDVLAVAHPSNVMAIVISGDGGWRDLDRTIAENLQQRGVPVIGWDSLRYFWSKKTPQQIADDLANVMRTFMDKWQTPQVALLGYSFGADVLPFAYNRLPDDLRSHVVLIALLGFSKNADFQITVSGWLGEPPGPEALPVLPEVNQIPPTLMQCFYGEDEDDSDCPELQRRGVQTFRISGGHHFNGDYAALARDIMERLQKVASRTAFER